MPSLNISSTQRVIIDIACFSIICSLCLLIHLYISPYKQGFWCNDKSIRYPYVKDSNVLSLFLVIFGFFLPIISIIIFESIEVNKSKQSNSNEFSWKSLTWKIYKNLIVFIMGSISLLLMTITIKLICGRLKPYFIEICNPDVDCNTYIDEYIDDYTCINDDETIISDARMSFTSGYSAFSSYSVTYFVIHLNGNMKSKMLISLRTLIQLTSSLIPVFVGLNQVAANRHHWTDVLGGFVLGLSLSYVLVNYLLNYSCGKLHYVSGIINNSRLTAKLIIVLKE